MVPSIAYARAHHLAKRAVERELAAQGRRAPFAEIIALAQAYRAAHQEELLAQAAEAVKTSPWHRMMADREVRELEQEQRKRTRAGIVENPDAPLCLPSQVARNRPLI